MESLVLSSREIVLPIESSAEWIVSIETTEMEPSIMITIDYEDSQKSPLSLYNNRPETRPIGPHLDNSSSSASIPSDPFFSAEMTPIDEELVVEIQYPCDILHAEVHVSW